MSTYLKINLIDHSVILSWQYPQTSPLIVADFNNVDAQLFDDQPLSVRLPAANNTSTGQSMVFNNVGNNRFELRDGSASLLYTLKLGEVITLYLTNNSTPAGVWQVIPFGGGEAGIVSVTATSPFGSLAITGGTEEGIPGVITPPGGDLIFEVAQNIGNILNNIVTSGYAVINTATTPWTWATRTLTGDTNISIDNADGVLKNSQIKLNSQISGLTSLKVGNIELSEAYIEIDIDQDLNFDTDGIGLLKLNEVNIDTDRNITNVANLTMDGTLTVTGTFIHSSVARGWCFFTDQTGTGSNITLTKSGVISSITGTNGIYTISFTIPFSDTTYAVFLNLQRSVTASIVPFQAFVNTSGKTVNSVIVYAIDTLGNILPAIEGMSVVIYSN